MQDDFLSGGPQGEQLPCSCSRKRRSAEVVADNIYFGDSKRDSDQGGGQNNSGQQDYGAPQYGGAPDPGYQPDYGAFAAQPTSAAAPGDFAILEDDDSELPF